MQKYHMETENSIVRSAGEKIPRESRRVNGFVRLNEVSGPAVHRIVGHDRVIFL